MAIHREKRILVCECDSCGADTCDLIVNVTDWHKFIEELKDAGWKITKDDDEWKHECEDCSSD